MVSFMQTLNILVLLRSNTVAHYLPLWRQQIQIIIEIENFRLKF